MEHSGAGTVYDAIGLVHYLSLILQTNVQQDDKNLTQGALAPILPSL